MTPAEAAALLDTDARRIRAWLRRQRGRAPAAGWTIDTATFNDLREAFAVEQHGRTTASSRTPHVRDEIYVVDLCDELFGLRASRQHRFEWLVGDPARDGRARQLPVDAYYEELDLVVEYRELQHDQPVKFFDKADRMTISGVHRGEQRRIYDERRDDLIPRHGLRPWVVSPADVGGDRRGRLSSRDHDRDVDLLRSAWRAYVENHV